MSPEILPHAGGHLEVGVSLEADGHKWPVMRRVAPGVRAPERHSAKDQERRQAMQITGPDAFKSTATLDLFDATGNKISPEEGCPATATATRFE